MFHPGTRWLLSNVMIQATRGSGGEQRVINPEEIQPVGGGQGGPAQRRPRWLRRLWAVHFCSDSQQGRGQAPSSWPGRQPPLLAVGLSSGRVD